MASGVNHVNTIRIATTAAFACRIAPGVPSDFLNSIAVR
jgi:hypothetical protein